MRTHRTSVLTRLCLLPGLLVGLVLAVLVGPTFAAGVLVGRGGEHIGIRSHRVSTSFEDGIARTTVRQTFVNQHAAILEAVYLFPLPEGAALTDVTMIVGGKRLEGLLAERQKARRVYNAIKRRHRDPALVEQIGRSKFRLSVYPVVPKVETVIEITYLERVPLARGAFRYVYPLAIGGKASKTEHDFTFTMSVKSAAPLEAVMMNERGGQVVRTGEGSYSVSFEKSGATLDRDITIVATLRKERPALSMKTFRDATGDGWFLLLVTPPPVVEADLVPRDVILVMDTSGSMEGEKIKQAKASALYLLDHLRAVDRVNVFAFSSDVRPFASGPVPATPENLSNLRTFVSAIEAKGGTAIAAALKAALASTPADDGSIGRARTVVFLTDGLPTIGETSAEAIVKIAKQRADAALRVFPFGVGSDVAGGLLDGIAEATRGRAEIFRMGGEIETRLRRFLDRTSAPVLANLKLDAPGTHDVFPRPLPDVYLGEQVAIVGRYRDGGPRAFTLDATAGDRDAHFAITADLRADAGGSRAVRDLFARMKIDFLERQRRLRLGLSDEAYYAALDRGAYSTADEIVKEIIQTSLAHGVQSAYTSFIALLPEDRHRIDPRDPVALQQAIKRRAVTTRRIARGAGAPQIGADPTVPDEGEVEVIDVDEEVEEAADQPYEGKQSNAAIGLGGGAGGKFSGRARGLRRRYGGEGTAGPVEQSLEWLARTQVPDEGRFHGPNVGPGNTGLALLAFLGAGYTHQAGKYKKTVMDTLKYLRRIQTAEGRFGPHGDLVDHAIATLALSEAYGQTNSPTLRRPVERALQFLERTMDPATADAATLTWSAMALISARSAGLVEPQAVKSRLRALIDRLVVVDVKASAGPPSSAAARDAAVVFLRCFALGVPIDDKSPTPVVDRVIASLAPDDPAKIDAADTALWYFGTLAGFHVGGTKWRRVNKAMKVALSAGLVADGKAKGSWPATGPDAARLGEVGTTALRTLGFELYYRYGKVFGTR